jgi:hypothetical protein
LNLWGRFFKASNIPGNSGGSPVALITATSNWWDVWWTGRGRRECGGKRRREERKKKMMWKERTKSRRKVGVVEEGEDEQEYKKIWKGWD